MAGSRHSKADHRRIRGAREAARQIDTFMAELGDDDWAEDAPEGEKGGKAVKAISLNGQIDAVARAVAGALAPLAWGYPEEVYPDYAIVCVHSESGPEMRERYFQAAYTIDADGVVTMAPRVEWTEVREAFVPVVRAVGAQSFGALTVPGGPVKALDESGRVGGYLVTFTNADQKDMVQTYFQADTYYGPRDGDGADVMFHHGYPITKAIDPDRLFQPMKTKKDAIGVWAETVLNMADEYEAKIFELIQAGKIGWSSGAPEHMVRVNADGKITRWPIAEGSFTPTPAEPSHRFGHRIMPIRTYHRPEAAPEAPQEGAQGGAVPEPTYIVIL